MQNTTNSIELADSSVVGRSLSNRICGCSRELFIGACHRCGTPIVGRVLGHAQSLVQRFYKCSKFKHVDLAFYPWFVVFPEPIRSENSSSFVMPLFSYLSYSCGRTNMWSTWWANRSFHITYQSSRATSYVELIEAMEALKKIIGGVHSCTIILETTTTNLKVAEATLKGTIDINLRKNRRKNSCCRFS